MISIDCSDPVSDFDRDLQALPVFYDVDILKSSSRVRASDGI